MKTKLSIIVFLLFMTHSVVAQAISQQTFYTCVMHPEIHETKPGKCPKCGMALVKEKAKPIKKTVSKKPVIAKKKLQHQSRKLKKLKT